MGEAYRWEQIKAIGETLIEAVPDVRFDVLDVVAQGEMGAVRLRGTGTHEDVIPAGLSPDALPGWSRSIDFEECIFSRFDADARIVEEWAARELSLADKRFLDLPTTAVPMSGVIRWTTRTSTRLCAHDEHADIPGSHKVDRGRAERGHQRTSQGNLLEFAVNARRVQSGP